MRQTTYLTVGVVLARRVHGEADRILTVFSKHHGKIRLLAKGVRKPKSRKRGHIEIFSLVKFSATKLTGIDLINEAVIINGFTKLRSDLKKIALAYYFVEVIGKATREGEKNNDLFDLLINYLDKLGDETNLKSLRREFTRAVLVSLGFWPNTRELIDVDKLLEEVIERKINAVRVGKKMLQ